MSKAEPYKVEWNPEKAAERYFTTGVRVAAQHLHREETAEAFENVVIRKLREMSATAAHNDVSVKVRLTLICGNPEHSHGRID